MSSQTPTEVRRRLAIALVLPLIAFLLLRRAIGSATGALAITDAIALILSITFGGSSLPLELRRSVFPGALGLGCLISLAFHKPLLAIAAARFADARPEQMGGTAARLKLPGSQRALTTLTAIIGVTATADAAAQIVLALTVSTSTFAEVARVASYAIIGSGLGVSALYLRRVRGSPRIP
jgi:hypothetical protein